MNGETILFETKDAFRAWLEKNTGHQGLWLTFGKKGGPKTLTAAQALEEALCFGWIDGQMRSVDQTEYVKYFSPRRQGSKWSEKNRKLAAQLEEQGRMTDAGRAAIAQAKERGTWEGAPRSPITQEQVAQLSQALEGHQLAQKNYLNMPPSAQRAYAGGYLEAKTPQGRERRLSTLIERLELNLNPMESLEKKKAELGL